MEVALDPGALAIAREMFAEAVALEAKATALPRRRFFKRWRLNGKADALRGGAALFLQSQELEARLRAAGLLA